MKEKEVFKPITPGEAKIYVCGVTPYNHPHIGNARPAVTWDVIRRYLEYVGYKVEFVQNFTDVDDKIINKANAEGTDWKTISDRYIDAYFQVMDALHVRRADVYPRVSEHMDDIIHMVETLIQKGHAYVLGGDVYSVFFHSFSRIPRISRMALNAFPAFSRDALLKPIPLCTSL
jgi:cysteinyl-tRNA synthetase